MRRHWMVLMQPPLNYRGYLTQKQLRQMVAVGTGEPMSNKHRDRNTVEPLTPLEQAADGGNPLSEPLQEVPSALANPQPTPTGAIPAKRRQPNAEIQMMARIDRMLAGLSPSVAYRILRWLTDRYTSRTEWNPTKGGPDL